LVGEQGEQQGCEKPRIVDRIVIGADVGIMAASVEGGFFFSLSFGGLVMYIPR
jgi:hypothetical protein